MKEIEYVKMNPNQNVTILVLDEYPRIQHASLAKQLMLPTSVYGEQVGFVEKALNPNAYCRLQMMGGEFCSNAVASLAAYLAYERRAINSENKFFCTLECSGIEQLIECEVLIFNQKFHVKIPMPLPCKIREENLVYQNINIKFGIIEYKGICHVVILDDYLKVSEALIRYILYKYLKNKYLTKGISLFSEVTQSIRTLIYVRDTNTEIWENSCGIASASVAIYMAYIKQKNISLDIQQSCGEKIKVQVLIYGEKIYDVKMEEDVFLVSKGVAFI